MSIARSEPQSVGDVLLGNRFIIPSYQRKYRWTQTQTKALWDDISSSIESTKHNQSHCIGTLCLKESGYDEIESDLTYEVIDGQQRLTTIILLMNALIQKIASEEKRHKIRQKLVGDKHTLKLQAQDTKDQQFFTELMFMPNAIKPHSIKRMSQKRLYEAWVCYDALVSAFTTSDVETWLNFVTHRLTVLVLNITNESEAVKMFAVINDRGLPLSILDKIKGVLMMYSTSHLKGTLNETIHTSFEKVFDAQDNILMWRGDLNILSRYDEDTLVTHHYYSARRFFEKGWRQRDGVEAIFDKVKNECQDRSKNVKELKSFIKWYTEDFGGFAEGYSDLVYTIKNDDKYYHLFNRLDFTATLYPVIVRLHMQNKLTGFLALLESIDIRVYKLRGTNPTADMYIFSSELTEERWSNKDISERLRRFGDKFLSDGAFEHILGGDIYTNTSTKYMLTEYDAHRSGSPIADDLYQHLQKEHIFSGEPNFDVKQHGFDDDYDYIIHTLGNLTLLEEPLNKKAGNRVPTEKTKWYLKSEVGTTRELASEIDKNGYTRESIDKRTKDIVDFCLQRFKYE